MECSTFASREHMQINFNLVSFDLKRWFLQSVFRSIVLPILLKIPFKLKTILHITNFLFEVLRSRVMPVFKSIIHIQNTLNAPWLPSSQLSKFLHQRDFLALCASWSSILKPLKNWLLFLLFILSPRERVFRVQNQKQDRGSLKIRAATSHDLLDLQDGSHLGFLSKGNNWQSILTED